MGRLHLFELGDQPWLPAPVHRGLTEFLAFAANLAPVTYARFAERLREAMAATGDRTILDLASGAGGPVPSLLALLAARDYPVTARLSDLRPHREALAQVAAASGGAITVVPEPVDAAAVPPALDGFRLIANAFHHFRPEAARRVLADAVRQRRGIAVLEATERRWAALLTTLLSPLVVWALTPFMRPRRLDRLALTYLVPLIPLCTAWDGLVSCLRVYSPDELRALAASLPANDHVWEAGRVPFGPIGITYLIGRPRTVGPRIAGQGRVE
jgi:hypothetical protein